MSWYKVKKYKDGQISVSLDVEYIDWQSMNSRDFWFVDIGGVSYEDLFVAASVKEAFNKYWKDSHYVSRESHPAYKANKPQLVLRIKCLISQRSDRRFEAYDSFDLKVVANFINSMGYDIVKVLDPHSDVTMGLIDNSFKASPFEFVKEAAIKSETKHKNQVVLVSPDAGAYKKIFSFAEKLDLDMVAANKVRMVGNEMVINVIGDVKDKTCLIVDDIADGGRTFTVLAKKLKELGASHVYLYVTHGMFHYGVDELKENIDGIFTTDSYRDLSEYGEYIKQFKIHNYVW